MDNNVLIAERVEIYDAMGWVLPSNVEEGYDINGFPVSKVVGAIIDNRLIIP